MEGPRGAVGVFILMLPAPLCGDAGWLHPSLLGDFFCWGGLVLLLPAPLCGDAGRQQLVVLGILCWVVLF